MSNWQDEESKVNAQLSAFWQTHRPLIIAAVAAIALLLIGIKAFS